METKPMTLAQAWKECLRMWEWIVKEIEKGTDKNVYQLRRQWLASHGYEIGDIESNCFFCYYATMNCNFYSASCSSCPGKLVSKRFSCKNKTYDYYWKPKKFYKKLLQLDAKRRGK